ncbi:MAG: hypothetical protein J7L93_00930 [Thermoplasmata archaeon]|nr:hypothetical protein [Thermoplasmata archaeon]
MEIELKVGIKNTEDGARIRQALLNIFPDATVEEEGGIMAGVSRDAGNFKEMLKNQRIRDTARQFLSRRARNGMLSFKLNKQAAYAGKVNFAVVSHPMGEMEVKIKPEGEETVEGIIEWLTEI